MNIGQDVFNEIIQPLKSAVGNPQPTAIFLFPQTPIPSSQNKETSCISKQLPQRPAKLE